jgi:ABC-type dipeptide/oligopeptide/nickel transport system permease component
MGITFVAAIVYVGINFVVDLSYALLDPRAVRR